MKKDRKAINLLHEMAGELTEGLALRNYPNTVELEASVIRKLLRRYEAWRKSQPKPQPRGLNES